MNMNRENWKFIGVTPPGALIDNASATTAEIDTKGFERLRIFAYLGATDIALTALKIGEGDVSGAMTDITASVFGTATDLDGATSALPTDTDDNKAFAWDIDLRGRKRYLDVVATVGNGDTGGYVTIFAFGLQHSDCPNTVATHGCGGMLQF